MRRKASSPGRRRGLFFYLFLTLALLCCAPGAGRAADEREYKVEAVFLYNFFNYITWPGYSSPEGLRQVTICTMGDDPVERYLAYVGRRMAHERTLKIRALQEGESPEGCHMVFLRRSSPLSQPVKDPPPDVLTVAMGPDFLANGGMIELTHEQERMAIAINRSLLAHKGFQVSSRLLDLAREVR
jgi:hypothetical protein